MRKSCDKVVEYTANKAIGYIYVRCLLFTTLLYMVIDWVIYITGHTSNASVTCLQFCRELSSKIVLSVNCTAPGGHFDLGTFPLSSYTTAVQTVLVVNLVFGRAPVSNFRNRCVGQMSFEITGLHLYINWYIRFRFRNWLEHTVTYFSLFHCVDCDGNESGTFRPQTISSPSRFAPKTFPPWSFPPWSFRPH